MLVGFILTIIFMVMAFRYGLIAITSSGATDEEVSNFLVSLFSKTFLLVILLSIISVLIIIFYVLAFVQALKLDKTVITVLFALGFFIPVVGIVALFMFLSEVKAREPIVY